jgi:hypothetical protein
MSPVYAFFHPKPQIDNDEVNEHHSHIFKCRGKSCKVSIRCFLDTMDARSTSNMCRHVRGCWGSEALDAADSTANADQVRTFIVDGLLKNGTITQSFE